MSADPDELEQAEQKGYDIGLTRGFNDGIRHAAGVTIDISGEHFKNGNDKLAQIMRDHYSRLQMELREPDDPAPEGRADD